MTDLPKALINKLKDKYAQTSEAVKRTGLPILKLKDGESQSVRLMLFEHDGEQHLFHEVSLHFINRVPVTCSGPTRGSCLICQLSDFYRDDMNNKSFANQIRVQNQYYLNAVNPESGELIVLAIRLTTFNDLLSYFADEEYRPFMIGKNARNIKIERTGTELDTVYHLKLAVKDTEVKQFPDPVDFIEHFQPLSNEEMDKRIRELMEVPPEFDYKGEKDDSVPWHEDKQPAESAEEETDEYGEPIKKKSTKKAKPKDEDEPEPDEDEPEHVETEEVDASTMNPKLAATLKKLKQKGK